MRDESCEYIIGTDDGVVKCRTIKRKGSDEQRWDLGAIERMNGTPWEPERGRHGGEIMTRLRAWNNGGAEGPRVPIGVQPPRRAYRGQIRKFDVEQI